MVPGNAAQAYARVGIETGVHAADPVKLVIMLYDGAILAVSDAQRHLTAGRIADKGHAISKAIGIIDGGLRASLDTARGGAIAKQLNDLYDYMGRRLLLSSLRNDASGFEEVARLLRELRSAWSDLANFGAPALAAARAQSSVQPQPRVASA